MINPLTITLAVLALLFCIPARAGINQNGTTLLFGYEQGSIEGYGGLHGTNFKIIYEPDSRFGFVGSLTALKNIWDDTDEYHSEKDRCGHRYRKKTIKDITRDSEYYSAMFGPTLRVNDQLTVYGSAGLFHLKIDNPLKINPATKKNVKNGSHSFNNVAFGTGVILNVSDSLTLAAGYEGTPSIKKQGYHNLNAASLSVGLHF